MVESAVTKDVSIMELVEKYPDVIPVLMGYGLHCVGCSFSKFDTLENGAKIHGISGEDFEMMLKDVNFIVSSEK